MNIYVIFGAAVRPDGSPSGTLRRRTEGAYAFSRTQTEPALFLASGAEGEYPPAEAEVMRELLLELGVSDDQIIKDEAAFDTLDTVVNCAAIIRARRDVRRIYVCTSPYHSWRCQLMFRLIGIPALRARMAGDLPHLGWQKWLFYWFKECVAIPWDALLILINHRRA